MQYRLRLYPYSGGHDDLISEGDLKECRDRAAHRIRYHRDVLEYPVAILEAGMKWEMQTGDGAGMVGDHEGILVIDPICDKCNCIMNNDDCNLCERCQEQEDEEYEYDADYEGLNDDEEDDEEDFSDEDTPTCPEEGDYITHDHEKFFQDGKLVLEVDEDEEWSIAVEAHMEQSKFWPNVWFVSDHGNTHLIDMFDELSEADERAGLGEP